MIQNKNNEKKKKQQNKNFTRVIETFFDSFPGFVFIKDLKNNFIKVNDLLCNFHKKAKEEMENINLFKLYPKELAASFWKDDLKVLKTEKPVTNIREKRVSESNKKWVITTKIPYYNSNEDIIGIFGYSLDFSMFEDIEKNLSEVEEKFNLLTNTAKEMIITHDIKGNITYANKSVGDITGFTPKEILKKNISDFITLDKWNGVKSRREKRLSGEFEEFIFETEIKDKEGKIIPIEVSSVPMVEKGEFKGVLSISRDISERKESIKRIKESEKKFREAYNRAELYKELFTHDIGNIFQSILTGVQLNQTYLQNPENIDKSELKELRNINIIIREEILRGKNLISNISKLSKLDKLSFENRKMDLMKIIYKTVSKVKETYGNKEIDIKIESTVKNTFIYANELLFDAFYNLITNSIRHNKKQNPWIRIKIFQENENKFRLEFIDNGIGIRDSRKKQVFRRADLNDNLPKASGLGLSLVKRVVDHLNGRIWVEDRVPEDYTKGTKFIMVLPNISQN